MQNSPAARQAVVVGAGFAGAVTARELAERGLCVVVITHDGEFLRESGAQTAEWISKE